MDRIIGQSFPRVWIWNYMTSVPIKIFNNRFMNGGNRQIQKNKRARQKWTYQTLLFHHYCVPSAIGILLLSKILTPINDNGHKYNFLAKSLAPFC